MGDDKRKEWEAPEMKDVGDVGERVERKHPLESRQRQAPAEHPDDEPCVGGRAHMPPDRPEPAPNPRWAFHSR